MDTVRMDSTVPLAEIKPDREGLLGRIAPPPPCADAKPSGATRGALDDQDADECLTFERAPERSGSFRRVETFEKNQLRDLLWARE